jgi:membrane protease YdiL (CAAX protease family)
MTTIAIAPQPPGIRPVAPAWHTALLIAFFLGLTLAGAIFQKSAGSPATVAKEAPPLAPLYLSLFLGELALVFYVWKGGLRRSGTPMRELIGGRWGSAADVLRDLALAAVVWGAWTLVPMAWSRLFGADHAATVEGFLPTRGVEYLLWTLLSLGAGFCEELVFRGYLMRQFSAWTRLPWVALVLQSALFGVSHGYQGVAACMRIAAFGLVFGLLAIWRRSLRPGMIAHALTDVMGGIFRI